MNKEINNSRPHDYVSDKKLREFLRKELPEANENVWFTRKVLNRLPEKKSRKRPYYLIELASCVMAMWVCIALWILLIVKIGDDPITWAEVIEYTALSLTTAGLVIYIAMRSVLSD